ncbi:hypothetical protein [Asticcacaulis sp.]|uniref:hypothetical protein n=1 Tax=Asticcacaulis sp. TaxID=1872648 RepID=UPI002C46C0B5|nr:hypothetical protein [Asticcacaulis sp.]HTM81728.1 hypothetical protein [Asticcacaulis sp.]
MKHLLIIAASLLFATGCNSAPTAAAPQGYYAEINFHVDGGPEINSDFHEQLFDYLNGRQIRNGPIGLSAGETQTPDYKLQILGDCDGAVKAVAPIISRVAKRTHEASLIMKSFKRSATCSIVKREYSSPSSDLPNDLPYAVPVTSGQQVSQ